jgi:mannose-6-phosphate isomerase
MSSLYPFKFNPVFKDKVWGGHKIKTTLNMDFGNLPNCGEAWLLSGVEGNPTIVGNGYLAGNELNELVEVFMGDLVGDKVYEQFGEQFPILVKVIDSNDWLSVQVHPDDKLAAKRHGGFGKTEMWYIMQADENAQLISGFNQKTDREEYLHHFNSGTLKQILNFEKVYQGDVYFIPAGRVHALGPGCLLAEIQQTSDITYRIYDWDRPDANGKMRQLHTEEALEAISYEVLETYKSPYQAELNKSAKLVSSPFFNTNILKLDSIIGRDYSELDSFVIFMCIQGSCTIKWAGGSLEISVAETVLIPNIINRVQLIPGLACELLEVYIE